MAAMAVAVARAMEAAATVMVVAVAMAQMTEVGMVQPSRRRVERVGRGGRRRSNRLGSLMAVRRRSR